jgi:hypothetical protein
MAFGEKGLLPHMVYRLFDKAGTLLYVGCSHRVFSRLEAHISKQPWRYDLATVQVTWFDNWPLAAAAEQEIINAEKPKYNKLVMKDPSRVGACGERSRNAHPKGDGYTCPRCHGYKPDRIQAYCKPCTRTYQEERRIARGWVPRGPPTIICPRCKGIKEPGSSYCKSCKKVVNYEYRKNKALEARGLTW